MFIFQYVSNTGLNIAWAERCWTEVAWWDPVQVLPCHTSDPVPLCMLQHHTDAGRHGKRPWPASICWKKYPGAKGSPVKPGEIAAVPSKCWRWCTKGSKKAAHVPFVFTLSRLSCEALFNRTDSRTYMAQLFWPVLSINCTLFIRHLSYQREKVPVAS